MGVHGRNQYLCIFPASVDDQYGAEADLGYLFTGILYGAEDDGQHHAHSHRPEDHGISEKQPHRIPWLQPDGNPCIAAWQATAFQNSVTGAGSL